MSHWRVYGAIAAALGLAFLCGRMTVPAKVVSVEKLKEVQAKAQLDVAAAFDDAKAAKAHARKLDVDKSFLQDYHWTWHPDGTVEATAITTKKDTRSAASTDTASAEHKAASSSSKSAIEYRYLEKVTEAPKPKWSFGLGAGGALDFKPRYEAEVGHRIGNSNFWVAAQGEVTGKLTPSAVQLMFVLRWEH